MRLGSARLAAALLLLCGAGVAAHGVPPQTLSVAQSPWSSGGLIAPTTFGLLVTDDRCTWRWLCTTHLGLGPKEQPSYFATSSGALVVTSFSGLFVSRDRGCSFDKVELFSATGAADVAVSDGQVLVTTSRFGAMNGLARSRDDGRTFEWSSLRADTTFFTAVRVAPSRGSRVYVSSWYFEPKQAALFVSDDGATTFTKRPLDAATATGTVFTVHAVDRLDPNVVIASVIDDSVTPERTSVLRSTDAGQTFSVLFAADGRVNGVRQLGDRWWVAVGDRVYLSTAGSAFTALGSPQRRACVAGVGDETLACGWEEGLDGFALATLGEATTPLLAWSQLAGPVECPAGSPAAMACPTTWQTERAELGLTPDHVATCAAAPALGFRGGGCDTGAKLLPALAVVFFLRRRGKVESRARR